VLVLLALALGHSSGCKGPRKAPSASERTATATQPASSGSPGARVRIIDVHVHAGSAGIDRLLEIMDARGIDHAVNLSGGHALVGLQQQLMATASSRNRISTFATLPYSEVRRPGYGPRMAMIVRESHKMGAKGLKIAKALGLGMVTYKRKLAVVDDPELDVVFETAGELGMPVAIHTGDPIAFWDPVTPGNERFDELRAHPGWSLYGRNVPSFEELYQSLERRFERHPKTTFISVHFGNLAEDPDRVAQTLRKYPNVYIDTAARIPEMGRHSPARMLRFFEEFQDRIVYGSDLGVGPKPTPLFLGSSGSQPPTAAEEDLFFTATQRYFETSDMNFPHPTPIQGNWTISGINLPRAILDKVMFGNAARLLGLPLAPQPDATKK
jgi:predicted TIM-barrel fold metal-dependent hydrolase